ncbi:translesion error-prone DNA polymerase V autoproteolytic subunit [Hymenobacter sp. ASUV-10]|uniref:Translesion error-prone DNA polymerase V autoproteolytic subunit n=1 Tax=Hymenobacter aranciens TaxID=3063996 RepID=A0ABT9BHK7_9BACT|nr:translesion error-prone DNA polymerase V autoproteolytic subunit [Hymenobacter sp. ASUV-10]MDO7877758.1 translesion error-prone DNA polymerase V autoproteolytic subunit [Hymenobacter sp. ASUV-10]
MDALLSDFFSAAQLVARPLPQFGCLLPAGFPSPADDHADAPLDLTRLLFRHSASTFLARVSGDSMVGAGIHPGDLVAVDRARRPADGSIVVAVVEGEHTIKRLRQREGRTWLEAENSRYPPLPVPAEVGLVVWGVVTHVVHEF